MLTPRSNLHDGLLDFCLVKSISHGEFLRLLPELRAGAHVESEHVLYRQLPELCVEPSADLSVNADGEPIAARSFYYAAVPRALRVAIPALTTT